MGFSLSTVAQIRCGTVEYTEKLQEQRLLIEDKLQFEKWLQDRKQERARRTGALRTAATYQVPVVVHIIHNGEAIGSGKNISDAQVLSQISVLNKDYQRLNADASETPADFLPFAGAFDVEFIMAKQDPEGLSTNGIVRVQGPKNSWTMNDNYTLKALSYWPAEDYLNIWVCNLTDFLGFAQFPVSGLPGLENSSTNRLTDGVVIASDVFGSSDDGAFDLDPNYNKGRTATHEVGHFFGLRHIWGDDNGACTGDDYVDDTPNQSGSTSGCPSHPRVTCTSFTSMFQNFLDYTNDQCMNLFTLGQVGRMATVIENSPRRGSLTTSPGLSEPAPIANDLGIKEILSPSAGECPAPFQPIIEVRNYGNNVVTSARLRVRRDGVAVETKDVTFSPAIALLDSRTVVFNNVTLTAGNHNVAFEILQTNGVADPQPSNNNADRDVLVPQNIAIPFLENFNTIPASWTIINPDQYLTWELANTPSTGSNKALKIALFDYEDHEGEIDVLLTPVFDLSAQPAAQLKFDVAHARYQNSNDGLKVIVLSDCNADLQQGIVVYSKTGAALATTTPSTLPFTPGSPDEWRKESIDLSTYIGQPNLQLAFVSVNDWGNNLFIDNISLTTTPINDVSLLDITAPSPVTCANVVTPVIRIKNAGTLVNTLSVVVSVNGNLSTVNLEDLNLSGEMEAAISLNAVTLNTGVNLLSFELIDPNGSDDFNPEDNTMSSTIVVNKPSDKIPILQNFESSVDQGWTTINPHGGMNWQEITLQDNHAQYFNSFANLTFGDKAWMVSPVLDFSDIEGASLAYDVSYAQRGNALDKLHVLVSTDCGISFQDTIATLSGPALSNGRTSNANWEPSGENDWLGISHVLSAYAGQSQVRIAFVAENDNGNNLYIDNITFFVSEEPIKLSETFSIYPNPTTSDIATITFSLPEKGSVTLELIDAVGKVIWREVINDVLNQTFDFSVANYADGVYTLRMKTGTDVFIKRLMVVR
jgi:hypothetical protein